ncbi:MAG: hypothetical protein LBG87_04390 [Spirochaetaceae bacterium]|jgi:hypothetical protein|nr:hypothetical protein [Spirochaetaceae bacterium]
MSITSYLETLPLYKIARYTGGSPKNGISFIGYPRQHPSDKNKLILINDPLGENPTVMEFKIEDMLGAEEVHSAVTKTGDTAPLVKLWVRKGAHGVILEPFEVDDPIRFANKPKSGTDRVLISGLEP